jgi:hypothetical protein
MSAKRWGLLGRLVFLWVLRAELEAKCSDTVWLWL